MKYFFIILTIVTLGLFAFFIPDILDKIKVSKSCPEVNSVSQNVLMIGDSFQPETLAIKKCTKVVFQNRDNVLRWPASNLHPTHGIYPEFDPLEPIKLGKDWSFVFDKEGNWRYHDHLIPSVRGIVRVE